MRIEPFGVEQWMNEYETTCAHNLAETCVDSLTVGELLDIAGHGPEWLNTLLPARLSYGAIEGSEPLRQAIAGQYEQQASSNVLVTHGAIGANHLVYLTLVEPGDGVVSVVPTYQQHYSIPEALGAHVHKIPLQESLGWQPDLAEIEAAVDDRTQLVVLNNPNNPTGALMDRAALDRVAAICDEVGAWLLCDEVYRGVDHTGPGTTASVADAYERGISTGSMSKAFSLAGLRLGWVVGPQELLHEITIHRDYNTISVGMIDDALATLALTHADRILDRSRQIVQSNRQVLSDWVAAEPAISWTEPGGGTTALLKYDRDMSSRDFCVQLVEETGVMLTPGSALGIEGYLRIGFANDTAVLNKGLSLLSDFLR